MRSKSLTFLVLEVVEVFQGVVQDQVRYSVLWSSTLTLQFLVVVIVNFFNVFLPDVVPDSVLWSRTSTFLVPIADGVLWSRTSTFQFLATRTLGGLQGFSPDRVPHSVLWRRTSTFQFLALVPVVVFPQDSVLQRTVKQIIDIPVSRTRDDGGLPGFPRTEFNSSWWSS